MTTEKAFPHPDFWAWAKANLPTFRLPHKVRRAIA
jgi:hypothetical protein